MKGGMVPLGANGVMLIDMKDLSATFSLGRSFCHWFAYCKGAANK